MGIIDKNVKVLKIQLDNTIGLLDNIQEEIREMRNIRDERKT